MIKDLLNEIASHGDRGAVAPISRIDDLKRDINDLKNGEYRTDWIDRMAGRADKFIPDGLDFTPRSLISVVTPSPKVILRFVYRGRPADCALPPTFADMGSKDAEVLRYINACLAPHGFRAATADRLPQKMLAVHCGLGRYGRNNICFNEEFGSFIRVLSYVSDMPCGEADWFPVRRMEACEECRACANACPTSAIDPARHIINADICLTSMNEEPGEFPGWLDKGAHNCLVGCMKCQDCCPQNAHNRDNAAAGVSFTEEETSVLLAHEADEPYTGALAAKLEAAGVSEYSQVLPRNLGVLLRNMCPPR